MSVTQERPAVTADHLDLAALHLYELSKPEGGLPWDLLTSQQRERYRNLVTMTARSTDVTALRAGQERGAGAIAAHFGLALRECQSPSRRHMRFQAMDCIRAFEDQLMHGTEESDRSYLQLQDEERKAHVEELHARAILEDDAETVKRQARRDLDQALTGEGRF